MDKLLLASEQTGIDQIAIAGGVSANSGLRKNLKKWLKVMVGKFTFHLLNTVLIMLQWLEW